MQHPNDTRAKPSLSLPTSLDTNSPESAVSQAFHHLRSLSLLTYIPRCGASQAWHRGLHHGFLLLDVRWMSQSVEMHGSRQKDAEAKECRRNFQRNHDLDEIVLVET